MKAIEKRTCIEFGRAFQLILRNVPTEVVHIARHPFGIDAERSRTARYDIAAQVAAKRVEQLGESVPGVFVIALGPEQRNDPVTADSDTTCGNEGEESQTPPL